MSILEYRLFNELQEFPVLYSYETIDPLEIALRFTCDYFIKNKTVYQKTSCAVEQDCYVIYVQSLGADTEDAALPVINTNSRAVSLQLRHYQAESSEHPLIHTFQFHDPITALLQLQSDFLYWLGQEWEKTSSEIDEDRKCYIYYANRPE